MVVGNGLIAKAFGEYSQNEKYLFFCSGVSNSMCQDQKEFDRENNLLQAHIDTLGDKVLIYFSTCSILDPSMAGSRYVAHKLRIETHIAATCDDYYIFRLSNVVGRTPNSVTVLNFLFNAVSSGQHFDLWVNSSRNLIDVEDAASIVRKIITEGVRLNSITNVANIHSYDVVDIVREIEQFIRKEGNYSQVPKGIRYAIPVDDILGIIAGLAIDFERDYLPRLLRKYYMA